MMQRDKLMLQEIGMKGKKNGKKKTLYFHTHNKCWNEKVARLC
jgi:hypothetical protein